jgi:hypothetical protein
LKSGLTPAKSEFVSVPRVLEAPVAFECKVVQVIETGDSGGAGNLVLCEVMAIHARQDILNEDGLIDPLKLELVGRMGGSWYTKTDQSTMFEIPKPLKTKGIGVDQLPGNAKESDVLTGNNLGRLGNVERKASKEEIMQCQTEAVELGFLELDKNERLIAIHTHVRALLEKGQVQTALAWVSFIEETGVD